VSPTFGQQPLSRTKYQDTVLITGCTKGGIGLETARSISLQSPKLLIITGRSTSKLDEAKQILHSTSPNVAVKALQLDLSSLSSVRKAANDVLNDHDIPKIDVLINNAGIMAPPYSKTVDGFESQLAANHLGHFLLANLLMPRILAAAPGSRIVNVSSRGHRRGEFRFDDPNFSDGATYQPFLGYAQSKTANILFSVGLAERLGGKGITSYSLHPGMIMTNLASSMGPDGIQTLKDFGLINEHGQPKEPKLWKTLGQGAGTSVVAAFDPRIEGE
jgi:NAD(P)-dependent dehydrogenase (short-subunit alcohol dehydrogenase family)